MIYFLRQRLSMVKMLPQSANQPKTATPGGDLNFRMLVVEILHLGPHLMMEKETEKVPSPEALHAL